MKLPNFNIQPNGDSAVTLIFEADTSETLTRNILSLKDSIITSSVAAQLIDIIPAYQSLTLIYDSPIIHLDTTITQISELAKNCQLTNVTSEQRISKLIKIPVCYEEPFAPDLKNLSLNLNMPIQKIIKKHTSKRYLVHFLGFLPGFLYLGGLDKSLHYPRKNTPAINIAKGSIGIGGQQTGIYPIESPGGWHIIGRTPLIMFDATREKPTIANPLDEIEFYSISKEEFLQINQQSKS